MKKLIFLLLFLLPTLCFAEFEIVNEGNGTTIFKVNTATGEIIGGGGGTNGVSVSDATVNATGWLNMTLSNSTVLGPWNVTGPQGTAGTNGTNGINGTTPVLGVDYFNGTNGINGTNGTNGTPDYNLSNYTDGTVDGDRLPVFSTTKRAGVPATGTPSGLYLKDDGTWATPSGAGYTLVAVLASNVTTAADVVPVNLTGLVWTYAANSVYLFRWNGGVYPTVATTGCGFQINVSSAVTEIDMNFYHQLANTGTLSGGHSIADDASVGVSSGMPAANVTYAVSGQGMLRTTSNTGTAQLRFRSETTAVTRAVAGMTLVVEKVQ